MLYGKTVIFLLVILASENALVNGLFGRDEDGNRRRVCDCDDLVCKCCAPDLKILDGFENCLTFGFDDVNTTIFVKYQFGQRTLLDWEMSEITIQPTCFPNPVISGLNHCVQFTDIDFTSDMRLTGCVYVGLQYTIFTINDIPLGCFTGPKPPFEKFADLVKSISEKWHENQ